MLGNADIPVIYSILWLLIPLVQLALLVVAIITLIRAPFLSATERVLWTLASVVLPVIGPVVWLIVYLADARRPRRPRRP